MVFNSEMESELIELYSINKNLIENKSRTPAAVAQIREGWANIVAGLNSKFPLNKVTAKQVQEKFRKLTTRAKMHDRKQLAKV